MKFDDKTKFISKEEAQKNKRHFLLDAKGKVLGRFASEIAKILRGKHKADFTPNIDTGDGVIVINADKIQVSGAKEAQKTYIHHTGWIGGLKEISYEDMKRKKPEYIIFHAVKGMMPKTKLAKAQIKNLKVFVNDKHNMDAQKPIVVNI